MNGAYINGTFDLRGGTLYADTAPNTAFGDTIQVNGNATVGKGTSNMTFQGPVVLNGNYTLTVADTTQTSVTTTGISRGFGFTKAGTGTLDLNVNSTYSGTHAVSGNITLNRNANLFAELVPSGLR